MIKRLVLMPFRFLAHPITYFDLLWYGFQFPTVFIKFYHKFILPRALKRIKAKKVVNVVFLAMNPDMWRYDGVFLKLMADKRFNPIIVTAVRTLDDLRLILEEQNSLVEFFSARKYPTVCGYDSKTNEWININRLKPDIIFYTQPYKTKFWSKFAFHRHLDKLFCYAPYSFQLSKAAWNWDNDLQNFCWRHYLTGMYQIEVCREMSRIKAENATAVGYCLEEEFEKSAADLESMRVAWRNDVRKHVVWAPHHSVYPTEMLKVSSFLEIADLMVQIRKEYADRIVFAFKPHPVLKNKLYKLWGVERTDAYYRDWAESENSFDAQGDYHALFSGSDAMIHCSGSFIVEYLYTNKPVQYVYAKTRNPPDLGEIGDAALGAHYSAYAEDDIRKFLDEVILGGKDTMKAAREEVAAKYLKSPNGKMFSENVYNDLVKSLGWS